MKRSIFFKCVTTVLFDLVKDKFTLKYNRHLFSSDIISSIISVPLYWISPNDLSNIKSTYLFGLTYT